MTSEKRLAVNPGAERSPLQPIAEMRVIVDAFAARYAAERVKAGADPEPLLEIFERLQEAAKRRDYSAFIRHDGAFHLMIVQLADIAPLERMWNVVGEYLEPFRAQTIRTCWPDLNVLFEAHRGIVDTICDGDSAAAAQAAADHLDAIWYRLAEHGDDRGLPPNPLDRACAYIALNLSEKIRLDMVAARVARTSTGHLSRLFRERYGTSFRAYVQTLRMQKAADMLRRTNHPVHRVAAAVGYKDGSRFAQHFSKHHRMAPTAYRRRK